MRVEPKRMINFSITCKCEGPLPICYFCFFPDFFFLDRRIVEGLCSVYHGGHKWSNFRGGQICQKLLIYQKQNWDFRQNIWISGACGCGHLKSPKKRPDIHKNARNPEKSQYLKNHMGRAPKGPGPPRSDPLSAYTSKAVVVGAIVFKCLRGSEDLSIKGRIKDQHNR